MDRFGPRRATVLWVVLVVLCLLGAGALAVTQFDDGDGGSGQIPRQLVEPRPADNVIWPYTSATKSPSDPKLALNVVVRGDAEQLRSHLTHGPDATWNVTSTGEGADERAGAPESDDVDGALGWADARGADRFVYVHQYALTERVNQTSRRPHRALAFRSTELNLTLGGQWVPESYQLHDGNYFGARDHVRVFESPYESDDWVAIQAHSEHWDWFRLRHTVHGIDGTQERFESELMDRWFVEDVWRMYFQNDGGPNSDGWVTVVDLRDDIAFTAAHLGAAGFGTLLAGLVGADRVRRRRPDRDVRSPRESSTVRSGTDRESSWAVRLLDVLGRRRFVLGLRLLSFAILFGALFGLYLFVRAAGVFLEDHFSDLSPDLIAGSLYLLVAVGLPVCADRFGRPIPPVQAFSLAAGGIAAAIVLDYAMLAIAVLPLEIVVHRAGVAIALGLIAAGSTPAVAETSRANGLLGTGIVLWVILLAVPLIGWL